jgi:hypothetical protein
VVVDLAVAEEAEESFDVVIADRAPKTDAVDVRYGYEHGCVVGHDAKMVKTAGRTEDGFLLDPLTIPRP